MAVGVVSESERAFRGRRRGPPCNAALWIDFLCCAGLGSWRCLTVRTTSGFSTAAFLGRTIAIVMVVGIAIAVVLLPFWIALIHYPVTQVPIPHPSRANYILSPQWGLNYFVVPYGALILALPFIFVRGS